MFKYEDDTVICEYNANCKTYIGKAKCHPLDKENYRKYIGEGIAQDRALIKYTKDEMGKTRLALKEVTHLLNVLEARPEKEPRSILILRKRKWALVNEIEDYKITIDMLRSRIAETEHAFEKYINRANTDKKDA